MEAEKWKYVLHLDGVDFGTQMPDVKTFANKPINECRYFDSLSQAFESLIKIDPSFFDKHVDNPDDSKVYYNYASIKELGAEEPLLEVARISMQESPDGEPAAGVYLHFRGIDLEDFQHQVGWDLSQFENYDATIPFLLLAKYSYTDTYELKNTQEYNRTIDNLKAKEDTQYFEQGQWQYNLLISEKHYWNEETRNINHDAKANGPLLIEKVFHYAHVREAFADLLSIDLRQLHEEVAFNAGLGMYIDKASISDILHQDSISLVHYDLTNKPSSTWPDGLYLKFADVTQFEELTALPIRKLKNYKQEQQCLLIAEGGPSLDAMIATKEFFLMLHEAKNGSIAPNISESPMDRFPEHNPFVVKVHWETMQLDGKSLEALDNPYKKSFASFDGAYKALRDLDDVLFERDPAKNYRYPLYIKTAAIFNERDQQEIMSKFMVKERHERLSNGVYVKLNQDALSMEVLKATHKELSEIEYAGSFHFLICKMKQPQPSANELQERPRKNHRFGKQFLDTATKGLTK